MDHKSPIYSEQARCRDCYKCIRECPVKAIRVVDGDAQVIPENCILCGHCVAVCPVGAKKVRDDLRRAVHLLNRKGRVILSLAPSFIGEFKGVTAEQLIGAVKKLGFYGVSETALGAQEVSAYVKAKLRHGGCGLMLSSACPSAVDLVTKYFSQFSGSISPVVSPLLAHCVFLRNFYSEEIGIVFAGPCIAKKKEADTRPNLLDVALTFEDLRKWLETAGIDLATIEPSPEDQFIPFRAQHGARYPIEGGMIATLQEGGPDEPRFMTLSGVNTIKQALECLGKDVFGNKTLFIELLACENGCIRGPKAACTTPVGSRMAVLDYVSEDCDSYVAVVQHVIEKTYKPDPVVYSEALTEKLSIALESIGKVTPDEELNCGSCGYGTCRDLACALLDKKAEPCMCISYMRQLAQKKANALIQTIPYGVVIVDKNLHIIDSNERFAGLFGTDVSEIHKVVPGLRNVDITRIVSFHRLFSKVLANGENLVQMFVRHNERVLAVTIFNVEVKQIVGALMRDITTTETRREQIIEKAQEVIRNTSMTAQQIAFLMGKNAAQSEKILNSLIESFSVAPHDEELQEN